MGRPAVGSMRDANLPAPSFRRLIEMSSESMVALDLEGLVLAANTALVQALNGEPAEGTALESLLRPEDRPAWRETWARLGPDTQVSVTARLKARESAMVWTLQRSDVEQAVYAVGRPAPVEAQIQRQRGAIHLEVLRSVVANVPLVLFAVDTRGCSRVRAWRRSGSSRWG
jgi:hypothetical protein